MRFTNNGIAGLKADSARYEIWEDGRTGLGVRVTPRSVKTFVFMYRFGGKARRMTLGRYGRTVAAGVSPLLFMAPATIAASAAFMLPVSMAM